MIRLGLTGGIGSGKSTVAKIFELLQIPVFYADNVGKWLLDNDNAVKESILSTFGNVYQNGKAQRKKIADIVFNNSKMLQNLNSIVHPVIIRNYEQWCIENKNELTTVMEAAILFENNFDKFVDATIVVYSPLDLRIKRVCERDGLTADKVFERINNQMDDQSKIRLADFVITNDDKTLIIPQILEILKSLKTL